MQTIRVIKFRTFRQEYLAFWPAIQTVFNLNMSTGLSETWYVIINLLVLALCLACGYYHCANLRHLDEMSEYLADALTLVEEFNAWLRNKREKIEHG